VSRREIKNMAASVRNRLLERSKAESQAFTVMLQRYGMERFLYRLSVSDYANAFYLKGAMLFWVWNVQERRTTMDIDLLGFMDNSLDRVEQVFRDICAADVPDDGLQIHLDTLSAQRIKEDADYEGVRVTFRAQLDTAVIPMQIDIGFGDRVTGIDDAQDFPVLLDMPAPRLKCYPIEAVIAEKFEAMIKLELLNSRMKDFYDIWLLSRQYGFDMPLLLKTCRATFRQRKTSCPPDSPFFSPEMAESRAKQVQWSAFRTKSKLQNCPETFAEVLEELYAFLRPLGHVIETDDDLSGHWPPGGPWTSGK
jgi:predicted nucleotidyltransferase component of viral defense system